MGFNDYSFRILRPLTGDTPWVPRTDTLADSEEGSHLHSGDSTGQGRHAQPRTPGSLRRGCAMDESLPSSRSAWCPDSERAASPELSRRQKTPSAGRT